MEEIKEEIGNIDDSVNIDELEISSDEMKSYFDGDLGDNLNPSGERKRKDPTEAEMLEYFKLVKEKIKSIHLTKGAKEFLFDDGFSCIARDQKNADRKHQNSKKVLPKWVTEQNPLFQPSVIEK